MARRPAAGGGPLRLVLAAACAAGAASSVAVGAEVCDHSALLQKFDGNSVNAKIKQHQVRKTGFPPIEDIGGVVQDALGRVTDALDVNAAFESVKKLVDELADFVDKSIQDFGAYVPVVPVGVKIGELRSQLEGLRSMLGNLQKSIHDGFQAFMAVTQGLLPSGTEESLIELTVRVDNASTALTNKTTAVIDRVLVVANTTVVCSNVHIGMALLQAEVESYVHKVSEFGTERLTKLLETLPEVLAAQISTAVHAAMEAVDDMMARVPRSISLFADAVNHAVDESVCPKDAAWRPALLTTFFAAVLMHMRWL